MKKLYFGTNLKMYKNIQETVSYLQKLVENTKDISREEIELFVIPSYTSLP
ncbi:MAG: triose-phosphate isomerase, partial [Clostridiales bacterium]|nr:triose-phosphate isomerase [Clostridiales bacterium]